MKRPTHNAPPRIPTVSRELVEWLERLFPNRYPDLPESHEAYCARVGEQRVLKKLRVTMEDQSRNVLENP